MQTVKEGNWQIEKYGQAGEFHHSMPTDALVEEASDYESLGLGVLADRSIKLAVGTQAKTAGQQLTTADLAVWVWRYPTAYSTSIDRKDIRTVKPYLPQAAKPWKSLTWPIPQEVRQIIRDVRDAYDHLEVWTPEFDTSLRIGPSPILLGFRGGQAWLLARWAEALEPWDRLKEKAKSRTGRTAARLRRMHTRVEGGEVIVGAGVLTLVGILVILGAWLGEGIPLIKALPAVLPGVSLLAWGILRYPSVARLRKAAVFAGWTLPEGF